MMYQFKVQAAYKTLRPEKPDTYLNVWINEWVEAESWEDAASIVVMDGPTTAEWSFPILVVDKAYRIGHMSAEQAKVHADFMLGLRVLEPPFSTWTPGNPIPQPEND
jgi:hypothetical protein